MLRKVTLIILTILLSSSLSFANGLSLNSIGPKALGMGGAFIGLADDYTAVYWNPAGITQIDGGQVGLFVTDVIPSGTFDLGQISAKTKTNHYIAPNIAVYMPLMSGDLTVGIGAYVPAGLGAEWDGNDLKMLSGGVAKEWFSKIAVFNISPAVAYKINDMFSIGAALNIYYGMFDMKRPMTVISTVPPNPTYVQYEETGTGLGYGVSIGALIKPIDILSIGLSFKTKTTVKFEGTAKNEFLKLMNAYESDYTRDLAWPLWFGGGIALKPIKDLTITADAQFSQWKDTEKEIVTTYKNAVWDAAVNKTGKNVMKMDWVNTLQIRFGAQYEINPELAVRAGFYTDPAPAPDSTLNIIFPSISYNALTFGASYQMGKIGIDFGFEYLMGTKRDIALTYVATHPDAMPGSHMMNIMAASIGFSYKFCDCKKK